jgi:surfeit locus 1 family protein
MTFRPAFWPTLFTVPALILILGLGFWQVERLAWKTELIERIHSRVAAQPAGLAAAAADPAANEYRRVHVAGEFLHDKEMYLAARSLKNNVGAQVVTPLRLDDGDVVLVNRGWIPDRWREDPQRRAERQRAGRIEVTGLLRQAQQKRWLQPENVPDRNVWFYYDLAAMRAWAGLPAGGLPNLDRLVLEADATPNPGGSPIGGQTRVDIPNDHLQYAITWFGLGLALAVIYLVFHHQAGRLSFGRQAA